MSAEYLLTIGDSKQLPEVLNGDFLKGRKDSRIVMIGRSNVGKSSLINALLDTKLAQVSKQPGKTRKIHFYSWKEAKKIVADLPGYGYAKASASDQRAWEKFIADYLDADPAIEKGLVLLDARHGPTPLDKEALGFLAEQNISVQIVFTKSDAIKNQSERAARKKEAKAALERLGYDFNAALWVSVKTGDGLKPLARMLIG